ncbi:MAG: hypothetical protein JXJ20_07310, partial [Anaerolineae bacterium]|nr:hypothetical protein [Anaerolineae bacterium]
DLDVSDVYAVLTVETIVTDAPLLSKQFTPMYIETDETATLTFTITNEAGSPVQRDLGFVDTLPDGLVVSGDPATPQCRGDVVISDDGTTITFTGGILVEGEASCDITVTVTSDTAGRYTNDETNISDLAGGLVADGLRALLDVSAADVPVYTDEDHARAQAPLCSLVGGGTNAIVRVEVPGGTVTDGSVFCRIINQAGAYVNGNSAGMVGIENIVNLGVLQAVDVFGLLHDGTPEPFFNYSVTVCLQGVGRFVYLDATQSPRVPQWLPSEVVNGYTCATIPNAGTVVLVP